MFFVLSTRKPFATNEIDIKNNVIHIIDLNDEYDSDYMLELKYLLLCSDLLRNSKDCDTRIFKVSGVVGSVHVSTFIKNNIESFINISEFSVDKSMSLAYLDDIQRIRFVVELQLTVDDSEQVVETVTCPSKSGSYSFKYLYCRNVVATQKIGDLSVKDITDRVVVAYKGYYIDFLKCDIKNYRHINALKFKLGTPKFFVNLTVDPENFVAKNYSISEYSIFNVAAFKPYIVDNRLYIIFVASANSTLGEDNMRRLYVVVNAELKNGSIDENTEVLVKTYDRIVSLTNVFEPVSSILFNNMDKVSF